jgi:molybdopterin synthase catalytic subunit
MDLAAMIADIRRRPDFATVGMILCHIGVVRGHSRKGRKVNGLRVAVDHERLERILADQKDRPGILDIRVAIAENRDLAVGDDVMILIVAGDIRENVIGALTDTLNLIKTTVTEKTEYFIS